MKLGFVGDAAHAWSLTFDQSIATGHGVIADPLHRTFQVARSTLDKFQFVARCDATTL